MENINIHFNFEVRQFTQATATGLSETKPRLAGIVDYCVIGIEGGKCATCKICYSSL
jgi:hypothetical protein